MNRVTIFAVHKLYFSPLFLAFSFDGMEKRTLMSGDPQELECHRLFAKNKRIRVVLPDFLSIVGFFSLNCLRYFVPTNANPKSDIKPKNFKTSVPIHYVNDEPIAACIELYI